MLGEKACICLKFYVSAVATYYACTVICAPLYVISVVVKKDGAGGEGRGEFIKQDFINVIKTSFGFKTATEPFWNYVASPNLNPPWTWLISSMVQA